jgi:hypothetical protein
MDLIQENQKLSILISTSDKLIEMVYSIAEVKDDRLIVDLPQYFMRYVEYLEAGSPLTVKVFSKLGTIDFNTVVITSPLEEKFEIELDYNAIKFTPDSDMPVVQAIRTLRIKQGDDVVNAKTFELSTAYVKFYSDKKFEIEDNINCELILPPDYGTIKFRATISEIDAEYKNEYTALLYNMNEQDRETLLYYMYVYTNNSDQE